MGDEVAERVISLPMGPYLEFDSQRKIVDALRLAVVG
jgi:dTDP-4-amino-4,6-dideoxygalactose transaminase